MENEMSTPDVGRCLLVRAGDDGGGGEGDADY